MPEALAENHFVHTALAVEFDAVVVDAAGEVALVEGDGVSAFAINVGLLVDDASNHIGDEEMGLTAVGYCEFDASSTIVGVGVVLLEYEVGFRDVGNVFEVVDDFDIGSLVVGRIAVGARQH